MIGFFGFVPTGGIERALQDLAKVHVFQFMPDGIRLALTEKIFQAELGGVHAQFFGDDIGVAIDGEGGRHRARTAVVTAGHGVGIDLHELDVSMLDAILAAGVMPSRQRCIRLHRTVAAAGVGRAHLARDDATVAHDAALDRNHRRMSRIAGRQLLGVGHDKLYRPAALLREKIENRQIDTVALAAELAADVDHVHADLFFGDAQAFGQLAAHGERIFHRRPDLNPAVAFDRQTRRIGLEISLMARRYMKGMFKDQIGSRETLARHRPSSTTGGSDRCANRRQVSPSVRPRTT